MICNFSVCYYILWPFLVNVNNCISIKTGLDASYNLYSVALHFFCILNFWLLNMSVFSLQGTIFEESPPHFLLRY